MFTNTYLPHVGGVARSVKTLEDGCRAQGHEVRVIAPEFQGAEESPDVLRVPAIQNFNGSDFCVRLPVPNLIRDFMEDFHPDIIHSHHPFLLGDAALREAWKMDIPIVFTHHTLYESYTHYVPFDSPPLKRMAIQMATEYCNLCDLVVAPSESLEKLLKDRQVITPIRVIPTGVDTDTFERGDGRGFREAHGISPSAKVIGHVGRLAKEKNLIFLAEAVALCLESEPGAVFLVVGEGDAQQEMMDILQSFVENSRVYFTGKLSGDDLVDSYAAIDCFVFSSQSETQGLVLAEAMAAGTPVVAIDGPGVRDILKDGTNGVLLDSTASTGEYAEALRTLLHDETLMNSYGKRARKSAGEYDTSRCVNTMLQTYQRLIGKNRRGRDEDPTRWDRVRNGIEIEWELFNARVHVASAAMMKTPASEVNLD